MKDCEPSFPDDGDVPLPLGEDIPDNPPPPITLDMGLVNALEHALARAWLHPARADRPGYRYCGVCFHEITISYKSVTGHAPDCIIFLLKLG